MKRFLPFLLLFAGLSAFAGPLRVIALHSVLAEVAQEVGGGDVTVCCLMPVGADPHTFNPAPGDVRALSECDLVLASGFGLEPYLDKLVSNSGTKARVLLASSAIRDTVRSSDVERGHEGHDHGEIDPHWWNGISNIREMATAVCGELKRLRPAASSSFDARNAAYLARLDALAAWARAEVGALPRERRHLVTSHDAFGYLARDYGFEVHPLYGVSPEAEPDARALAALIDLIRRLKIRAVFVDNTENPKLLAAMLGESGAIVGGTLYADGLGAPGSPAATVEDMFRHNIATIVEALKE
ncbi:MAG: zinc ABC transporter substrate-binding protein [Opitutaceae bacterium]